MLIIISFPLAAQKNRDVLYLKTGSTINGKLIEISDDIYKIQVADGSIYFYKASEVEKFAKETAFFEARKADGFGFALEAGLLAGAQNTSYEDPFSFNLLAGYTIKTKNIINVGSGVEFIGKPLTPLFLEYKRLLTDKKTTPFFFARGGALMHLGGGDEEPATRYDYTSYNYKGGVACAFGTGISWAKENFESYLSFAYRYSSTSYMQKDYNSVKTKYNNALNRLEIKFGFRF
jgi:hypothetical protein